MNRPILVVDDEPHIRRVVMLKLEGAGYDVCSATCGAAALDVARDSLPALIISDYKMPGDLNGIEFIKAVRRTEIIKQTPVVLLTGSVGALERLQEELGDVSGVTLLSKPFSPRNLVKEVQRILDNG